MPRGNNQAHDHGADQRSEDQHPVHRGRMWQDLTQHTCIEHAPRQVAQNKGKREAR